MKTTHLEYLDNKNRQYVNLFSKLNDWEERDREKKLEHMKGKVDIITRKHANPHVYNEKDSWSLINLWQLLSPQYLDVPIPIHCKTKQNEKWNLVGNHQT